MVGMVGIRAPEPSIIGSLIAHLFPQWQLEEVDSRAPQDGLVDISPLNRGNLELSEEMGWSCEDFSALLLTLFTLIYNLYIDLEERDYQDLVG